MIIEVAGREIDFKTHDSPHLDELVAQWLVERFGGEGFLQKYAASGTLTVGIGGGAFDEHPANGNGRKENECAATLIAKALSVDEDPALEGILRFVKRQDLKGGIQPFDLADVVRTMYDIKLPLTEILNWVFTALDAKYRQQVQFLTMTREEFKKLAQIEQVAVGARALTLVTVRSDDEQMAKLARSRYGANADIVILQNSSGQTQIFANKKSGLGGCFNDIIRMLRLEEQKAKGDVKTTDWLAIEAEGKVEGAEEWYYLSEGQMILNGSKTAPNVPPTKLSLERIQEIVRIGINPGAFKAVRAGRCQQGACSSVGEGRCPWHWWGLYRCRNLRRLAAQNNY